MKRYDAISLLGTFGALFFIVCLYTSPSHLFPALEVLRPAMLAALLMLTALVLRRVMRGEALRLAGPAGAAMVTVFALLLLSILWASDADAARYFALDSLKMLLAFAGLAGTLRTPWHVRAAMGVAVVAAIVPSWGTYQRWQGGIELVEGFRAAWIGLLANPNQLAMVMAITVPWALAMHERSRGVLKVVMLVSFALACTTVVLTHSRGGALGLAVAVAGFALLAKNKLRGMALAGAAAIAVAVLAPQSFWNRTETISSYERDASARGRLQSWETGFRALEESPLLGIGAGNYLNAWDRYMPRNVRERAYTSHNTWMEVLVELGAIGFVAFTTMLILMLKGLWRARDGILGLEARALLASMGALLVCGTTGGYAFNWFFYLALGVAGAIVSQDRLHRAAVVPATARADDPALAL